MRALRSGVDICWLKCSRMASLSGSHDDRHAAELVGGCVVVKKGRAERGGVLRTYYVREKPKRRYRQFTVRSRGVLPTGGVNYRVTEEADAAHYRP